MNETQLDAMLNPILEQCGLELETLETMPAGRRRLLRVVVDGDGPEGRGPTLDQIAQATRSISEELDESAAVGNAAYTLEVTSRGLSRPLTLAKHWRRNTGRLVKVQWDAAEETDEQRRPDEPVEGRITGSDQESAELEVVINPRKDLRETRTVRFADISKAVLVPELTKDDAGAGKGDHRHQSKKDQQSKKAPQGSEDEHGADPSDATADTTEEN